MLKEMIVKNCINTVKQFFPWIVKPVMIMASVANRSDGEIYSYTLVAKKNSQTDASYPSLSSKSRRKFDVGSTVIISIWEDKPVILEEVIL